MIGKRDIISVEGDFKLEKGKVFVNRKRTAFTKITNTVFSAGLQKAES